MIENINFPNLSIHLSHVGQYIDVFGFKIMFYGISIAIGMLVGLTVSMKEAKRVGHNPEMYLDFAIIAIILSVIGARIYYVIFRWDDYKNNLLEIFNVRGGGLAIYGGVIVAVITAIVFAKKKKVPIGAFTDVGVFGLVIGQVIGRWGNFFNREVFGRYTNSLLAMQLPLSEVKSSDVTKEMLEHLVTIDGIDYIQVHPTFLYESVWNLVLFILMHLYKRHKAFDGELLLMYLCGYGLGRFWIEGIRTDQLFLFNTKIPASQLLSAILVVGAIIADVVIRIRIKKNKQNVVND